MLDTLRQFIADLVSPTAIETRAFDEADYRLAATALLVHVISLDGAPTEVEKRPADCIGDAGRGRGGRSLSFHQRDHAFGR